MAKLKAEAEKGSATSAEAQARLKAEQAKLAAELSKAKELKAKLAEQQAREESLRQKAEAAREREAKLADEMEKLAKQTAAEQQKLANELAKQKALHEEIRLKHEREEALAKAKVEEAKAMAEAKIKLEEELAAKGKANEEETKRLKAELAKAQEAEKLLEYQKQAAEYLKNEALKAEKAQAELQAEMDRKNKEKDDEIARMKLLLLQQQMEMAAAHESNKNAVEGELGAAFTDDEKQAWSASDAETAYYKEIGDQIGGEMVGGHNGWYAMGEGADMYYYNAETEETSWEHPSVIGEEEALAASRAETVHSKKVAAAEAESEMKYYLRMAEENKMEITEMFEKHDQDKTGLLGTSELGTILSQLGYTQPLIDEQLRLYDANGDGKLSYDEFVVIFNDLQLAVSLKFQSYDTDGSGYIEETELYDLLLKLGYDEQICEQTIYDLDTDGDGLITFDEFVPLYKDLRYEMRFPALAGILRKAGLSYRMNDFLTAGYDSEDALEMLMLMGGKKTMDEWTFVTEQEAEAFWTELQNWSSSDGGRSTISLAPS